jgi:hypothetical protein
VKKRTNGVKATKALSMSEKNARKLDELTLKLDAHAADEAEVWGQVRTQVNDIHTLLFGSEKDPDRRGWLERIRDLEDYVGGAKRVVWLAVGGFVTAVFALLVAFAKELGG